MAQCAPRDTPEAPPNVNKRLRVQPSEPGRWLSKLVLALALLPMSRWADAAESDEAMRLPTPDWVRPASVPSMVEVPESELSDGTYWLLVDFQTRIGREGSERYRHFAATAANESGVSNIADLQITFDPSYQQLALHQLDVIRGDRRESRLAASRIQMLQREAELESKILDGSVSASIVLDDVRVGDVVEYAYTISGSNPVFGGKEFGGFSLQWGEPLERLHARLLVPRGRRIEPRSSNSDIEPRVRTVGEYREFLWHREQVPALHVEGDAPAWHDPYPIVRWSEFQDWSEVVDWAGPLYATGTPLPPELARIAGDIATRHSSKTDRLLAALNFAQAEIRYLGMEMGPGSHAPSPPEVVLQRRFGDCKDKTRLLVTLLRGLDIEANAALVSTDGWPEDELGALASPGRFNHVIAHARLDGETYWLDPTRPVQRSRLENVYQPDFGSALVIAEGVDALRPMNSTSEHRREMSMVFDNHAGFDEPADLTVTTRYIGGAAEAFRNALAQESVQSLEKRYLNYYARYYPGLQIREPLKIEDDVGANLLTIVEHYEIGEFWPYSEDRLSRVARLEMPDALEVLSIPNTALRQSPVGISHPFQFSLKTEVLLPEEWPVEPEHIQIDDPHFQFEYTSTRSAGGDRLTFAHSYRTLRDHVPVESVSAYAANVQRARDQIGYELSFYPGAESGTLMQEMNWPIALFALLLLGVLVWLAVRLYRFDPEPRPVYLRRPDLEGLGGWLVLLALGAAINPFLMLFGLISIAEPFGISQWSALTHPDGFAFHAAWAPVLLFELVAQLALIVLSFLVLVLFFKKRTSAPLFYSLFLAATAAFSAVDLSLIALLDLPDMSIQAKDIGELVRSVIQLVVWGCYFWVSVRVKQTFTRRLGADHAASSGTRPPIPEHPLPQTH